MNNERKDQFSPTDTALMFLVIGAAVGAGLALLFTTERGGRTRARIREVAAEAGQRARAAMDAAIERARVAVEHGREYIESPEEQQPAGPEAVVSRGPGEGPAPGALR